MKTLITAAVLSALTVTQATALSCLKPDVAEAYQTAATSALSYVVLKGTFAFTPPPETDEIKDKTIETKFEGRLLTSAGFTQQVSAPVEVNLRCLSQWCANIQPDTEYIAFVENDNGEKLTFDVDPCYGLAFFEPTQEDTKRVENCAQGGACERLDQ
jgi:hypothetical protein